MSRAPLSFNVLTTLAAQRFVTMSTATANAVVYPATNQLLPIGVTEDTVLETTSAIPVITVGNKAKLLFDSTVTTGSIVSSDSSGRGLQFSLANTTTALTLASAYGGLLVDAAVVTGTVAHIYILPGFDRE